MNWVTHHATACMKGAMQLARASCAALAVCVAMMMVCSASWSQVTQALLKQAIWLDASQTATIGQAAQSHYIPLQSYKRYALNTHTAWIRLSYSGDPNSQEDKYLYLPPMLFTSLNVYQIKHDQGIGNKPSVESSWNKRSIDLDAQMEPIYLGQFDAHEVIYIEVQSAGHAHISVYVDTKKAIKKRIAFTVAILYAIVTLASFITVLFLISLRREFDWAKLGITLFLPLFATLVTIPTGFLQSTLDIDIEVISKASDILFILVHCCIFFLFNAIGYKLSKNAKLFRIGIGIFLASLSLAAYALIDFNLTTNFFAEYRWIAHGTLVMLLTTGAVQSRKTKLYPVEKLSFAILLLMSAVLAYNAFTFDRFNTFPLAFQYELDPLFKFLIRISVALSLIFLVYFLSLKAERIRNADLIKKVQSGQLELAHETARLNKQRQLTGMLAHELKNPLMSSQLALSSIQKRLDPQDPASQRAASIQSSLDEIDRIIERCMEADSYEHGHVPVKLATFSLDQLMNHLASGQSNDRLYVIQRGIDSSLLIQSDPQYVLIILKNLVSNALKYSPPESLVELLIQPTQQDLRAGLLFSIANEVGAAGLPDRTRMFERYYRGEAALSQSGAGLGLWLAQEMASNLGTVIEAQMSENKISLSFFLPLKPAIA